jgi:hypothetical protein
MKALAFALSAAVALSLAACASDSKKSGTSSSGGTGPSVTTTSRRTPGLWLTTKVKSASRSTSAEDPHPYQRR